MPQSLSLLLVHLVFSTKERFPYLGDAVRPSLHGYLATVARNQGHACYRVGGTADHVHLAVRMPRTVTVASLVEEVKTSSSKWLKTQSPDLTAIRLAARLRRIFRGAGRLERADRLYRGADGTPSHAIISGGIPGIPNEIRDRIR